MLTASAIDNFKAGLRGTVLCPGDNDYDAVRTVPNAMIDRRPALIARCAGAADVVASVRFAREHDLLVSVRGGGHSVAGKSVCEGGMMIDLSGMKGARVDPAARTVRAEPGLTLGELDRETQAFGLATTLGTVSKTGISGLTLGAGWGHLHAKYGLALDNVISVDMVTAEGELLTANAGQNQDLFWGVRGSSGNLGIVTSLEYRLYEVQTVFGGAVFFPVAQTRDALRFFREFAQAIPDELVIQSGAITLPGAGPVFGVAGCYHGDLSEGEKILKPLRTLGAPVADLFDRIPYLQMQSLFDPFFPPGRLTYVKSNFLRELNDDAIETIASFAGTSPSPYSFAPFVEHWHGAATRVSPTDTAFPHRLHPFNLMIWSNWATPAETEKNIQWNRDCWAAMKPHLIDSSYVNYVSDEGEGVSRAAYGPNYERLLALKNRYDPANFFRMNHNIQPGRTAQAVGND